MSETRADTFCRLFNSLELMPDASFAANRNYARDIIDIEFCMRVTNILNLKERGPVVQKDYIGVDVLYTINTPSMRQSEVSANAVDMEGYVISWARELFNRFQQHEFNEWLKMEGEYQYNVHGDRPNARYQNGLYL